MADVSGITAATNWIGQGGAGGNPLLSNPLQAMATIQGIANAGVENQLLKQEVQNRALAYKEGAQRLNVANTNFVSGRLATLANLPPEMQTPELYHQVITEAASLGADPAKVSALRTMVEQAGGDPAKLQQLAQRTRLSMASPEQQLAMSSQMATIDNPEGTYRGIVGMPGTPNEGKFNLTTFVPKGVSPETLIGTTVSRQNADGSITPVPYGRYLQEMGVTDDPSAPKPVFNFTPDGKATVTIPGRTGAVPVQMGTSFKPPPLSGGGAKSGGGSQTAPTETPPEVPKPAPNAGSYTPGQKYGTGQGFVTKLPINQADALARDEPYTQNLMGNQREVAQMKTDYANILSELKGIITGPSTNRQAAIAGFFQKWANNPMIAGLTPEQLAQTNSLEKISQSISNRAATMLSGSNQSQMAAMAATPNAELGNKSNEYITHKIQGTLDSVSEKASAWNAWQKKFGPGTSAQFEQWWNDNVDIRHFQSAYMEEGGVERKILTGGMQPDQEDEFYRTADLDKLRKKGGWGAVFDSKMAKMPSFPSWYKAPQ